MFHIILFKPQIPPNTGNIGRLCSITQSCLHLIHPLGFELSNKYLRRSGMDYWNSLELYEHSNWKAFLKSKDKPSRIWLFTTHAKKSFWEVRFQDGDGLLFGNETYGSPDFLHEELKNTRIKIPHVNDKSRSINLSTCVGIATYEALRQCKSSSIKESLLL